MLQEPRLTSIVDYKTLDHSQLANIYREALRILLRSTEDKTGRTTYKKIADRMNVYNDTGARPDLTTTPDAIKNFNIRTGNQRYNANNKTLEALHHFFANNVEKFSDEIRTLLLAERNWDVINGRSIANKWDDPRRSVESLRYAHASFKAWFKVGDVQMARAITTFIGDYVMLRKSVISTDVFIKSDLTIEWVEEHDLLRVTNRHSDRQGVERVSVGFAIPLTNSSLCLILQVEDAQALEQFTLRVPMQRHFKRLMGFASSVIFNGDPMSARVFIERVDDDWKALEHRFELDDVKDPLRKEALEKLLDHEQDQSGTARTIPDWSTFEPRQPSHAPKTAGPAAKDTE
jgi:hypothetical protein